MYGEAVNPPEIIHSSLPLHQRYPIPTFINFPIFSSRKHEQKPPPASLEPRDLAPEDGGKRNRHSYMEPTTSSFLRRRSRLNLREKIFSEARKPSPKQKCPLHSRSTSRDVRSIDTNNDVKLYALNPALE